MFVWFHLGHFETIESPSRVPMCTNTDMKEHILIAWQTTVEHKLDATDWMDQG